MNLLADESVDRPIVERLRQEGHKLSQVFAVVTPGTIRIRRSKS
ncbi:MAG: hypothetical protein Fur0044_47170 [Anaerolineae bacterium]